MSGIIGGAIGYQLLRRLGKKASREGICDGSSYQDRSKLEVLFGAGIWDLLAGNSPRGREARALIDHAMRSTSGPPGHRQVCRASGPLPIMRSRGRPRTSR